MTQHILKQRQGLPSEMQILLRDYPREAWPDHPHFARSIQNWMGAHQMFRQLGEIANDNCEAYLDDSISADKFAGAISYYGDLLIKNLHGHHTWEDRVYFPELREADRRFNRGLETLEADHMVLDKTLDEFTKTANRSIKLTQLDEKQAREEVATLHECTKDIQSILKTHLRDEEDLIVPILLHHKMRG